MVQTYGRGGCPALQVAYPSPLGYTGALMADAARILDDSPPSSPQPIVVEQARQLPADDPFRFVPAFDALRALAILGVFTYHTRLVKYPGAAFGVDIFFTLSGFLITGVLLKEFLKRSSISVGTFYNRRLSRLYPPLVCMVVGYLVMVLVLDKPLLKGLKEAGIALLSVANWTRALQWKTPEHLGHLWSLAVEVQFCLVWAPFCAWVLRRWRRAEALAVACLGLAVGLEVYRHWAISQGAHRQWLYNGTDMRLATFALGGALRALLAGEGHFARSTRAFVSRFGTVIFLAGLSLHMYLARTSSIMRALTDTWHMVLIALSVVAMIAGLFGSGDSWLGRLLSRRPIRYLGWLSYGIYLWHYPVLHVLPVRGLPFPYKAAVVSVLTLACGALSYHFIENRGKKAQT